MVAISVVIITKNKSAILATCINAAKKISDDIIIIDNGSTDKTLQIARDYGCNVYQTTWDGYGANKNKGNKLAKYQWILSIDADEVPDEKLITSICMAKLDDTNVVYDIDFRSYFGKKAIKYGSWGRSHHIRLFNSQLIKWTETYVHETLVLPNRIKIKKLKGLMNHFSVTNDAECNFKAIYYAKLSIKNYYKTDINVPFYKQYLSPVFSFLKCYFGYFGFLDGREGFIIAQSIYLNKRLKYHYLSRMKSDPNLKYQKTPDLAVDYA